MAPCLVMIDEVEKAFACVSNSGQADSGVSSRRVGLFLSVQSEELIMSAITLDIPHQSLSRNGDSHKI